MNTVTSKANPLASLKMYAALVGGSATALLGMFAADSGIGKVLTGLALVATVITTYAVPNAEVVSEPDEDENDLDYEMVFEADPEVLDAYLGVKPVSEKQFFDPDRFRLDRR